MANIKSAKKRVGTNEKSRIQNVGYRSAVKTARKKVLEAIAAQEFDRAIELFRSAESIMAKACNKGVLKKNTLRRYVSCLSHAIGAAQSQKAA